MFSFVFGSLLQFIAATKSASIISPVSETSTTRQLARHKMSLSNRYPVASVSEVFKKNILLTLLYMRQKSTNENLPLVNNEPFEFTISVAPDSTIAFHDNILPKYKNKTTTWLVPVHFSSSEGFISDGYLVGDGVCHLASLLGWVAKDAQLSVEAPTNHDFAVIPEIPKDEGISIYSQPNPTESTEKQNVYIHNPYDHPVLFTFLYDGDALVITASFAN
jgi:hypothetical protein